MFMSCIFKPFKWNYQRHEEKLMILGVLLGSKMISMCVLVDLKPKPIIMESTMTAALELDEVTLSVFHGYIMAWKSSVGSVGCTSMGVIWHQFNLIWPCIAVTCTGYYLVQKKHKVVYLSNGQVLIITSNLLIKLIQAVTAVCFKQMILNEV